ncbi:MAG: peptidoglycan editing factor PgeF [Armatimonadota bacterium]|nr:peptidoglycan editing factor PgeF [Armatimonadota bacterium]MDR7451767.1 peptidoglycan editing factor PgeF [Armatimonadota bacterium]MDR7467392.1 peptidoglycan editing factor PgeF [Armatimonadota bacterium]MDR7494162.1 peptidoglycan editing factor PgeF [Armatimonadota bacterium]MDR7498872.1 peptidoglycan editing factor PgeF [Armatimonadota bacterium]
MAAPPYLFSGLLRAAGIPHAFTTRAAGNMSRGVGDDPRAVAARRAAAVRALGCDPARHVEAEQVHGVVVAAVTAGDGGRMVPGADGLVSLEPGTVLAVHSADCVPLLLADPSRGVVAAIHAGWRGVAAGIPVEAVRALSRLGGRPADVVAAIGPSIGPCHYEVDEPVIEQMRRWPWWPEVARRNGRERWQLDLRTSCIRQLTDAGLAAGRIEVLAVCTYERPELLYSYRRDRTTGRMAALVAVPRGPEGTGGRRRIP